MTWARFDDSYPHHPKLLAAGVEGFALDAAAICYCNRLRTDGFIADSALAAVLPTLRQPMKWARKLVEVGRWERQEGGWSIHDFLDFNPSAEESKRRHEARAEAGRLGGKRSSARRSKPQALASAEPQANGNPVPSRPLDTQVSSSTHVGTRPDEEDELWQILAQKRLEAQRAKGADIPRPEAWLRSTATNARTELEAEAERLRATYPDLTPARLADALNGNRECLRYERRVDA